MNAMLAGKALRDRVPREEHGMETAAKPAQSG